jgi:hypothetical protein
VIVLLTAWQYSHHLAPSLVKHRGRWMRRTRPPAHPPGPLGARWASMCCNTKRSLACLTTFAWA